MFRQTPEEQERVKELEARTADKHSYSGCCCCCYLDISSIVTRLAPNTILSTTLLIVIR